MSALLRWGFDRKAGAKKRPVPLVRAFVWPTREAKPRVKHGATVEAKAKPCVERGVTVEESKQAEAMLPKPASVPVAVAVRDPLPIPSPPVRACRPAAKIALAQAPSAMEAAAQEWHRPARQQSAGAPAALPPVPCEDGKVWCEGCDARVPAWFGRDCISATCSLKGSQ